MGIDAQILIRYKGAKPTDKQLADWSWRLMRTIGHDKFFTSDGLPQDEYKPKYKEWSDRMDAHPLWPKWRKEGDRAAYDVVRKEVGEPPKELRRAIEFTNLRYPLDDDSDVPPTHWEPGKAYTQDGDPILAEEHEWFMDVNVWTRYYGVGYERGDILSICAIAEWIEANMPGAVVYYGGDSSGVLAEPFDEAARLALRKHFYSEHGRDYFSAFGKYMQHEKPKMPMPCGLCVPGEPRFNQHGFGGDWCAVHCAACGKSFESRDNGVTWTMKANEE